MQGTRQPCSKPASSTSSCMALLRRPAPAEPALEQLCRTCCPGTLMSSCHECLQRPPWQHPVVKVLLTNGAVLGLGVVVTLGIQRWQRHRHSHRGTAGA